MHIDQIMFQSSSDLPFTRRSDTIRVDVYNAHDMHTNMPTQASVYIWVSMYIHVHVHWCEWWEFEALDSSTMYV